MLQEQQAQAAVSAAVEEKNRMYMYMDSLSTLWLDKCHSSYILNSFHNINNSKQRLFWKFSFEMYVHSHITH